MYTVSGWLGERYLRCLGAQRNRLSRGSLLNVFNCPASGRLQTQLFRVERPLSYSVNLLL